MRIDEAEVYRLHAKTRAFKARVAAAQDRVLEAMERVPGEWGISVSGGKDSTALVHLAVSAGWRGRLFHFHCREHPPANRALVHALAGNFGIGVVDVLVPGDWDIYDKVGHFFVEPTTDEERKAYREIDYRPAVDSAVDGAGFVGLFWGMRKEESRARRITLRRYGHLYRAKSRNAWTCCPLADFSGRDVWAYLTANNLPWLPVYDLSGDRERERSELTWLGFPGLWSGGIGRRLREQDPGAWAEFCRRFPGLEKYG